MRILIYGDSNTWGQVPNVNGYSKDVVIERYALEDIWWYKLNMHNELIVNGLPGRAICNENPWLKDRNAFVTFDNDIKDIGSIDVVIIQLGTNDCKSRYNLSSSQITLQMRKLINKVQDKLNSDVILLGPPKIKEGNRITDRFYKGGERKSAELDVCFSKLAEELSIGFVSGGDCYVGEDGEHLTIEGHKIMGKNVFNFMNRRYNNNIKR